MFKHVVNFHDFIYLYFLLSISFLNNKPRMIQTYFIFLLYIGAQIIITKFNWKPLDYTFYNNYEYLVLW